MKYLALPFLLIISAPSFGQNADSAYHTPVLENKAFHVAEQLPEYPGGEDALLKFIQRNINYPKFERENDIQGRVVVGFIVGEDGSLSDISVKKGVSKGIDEEAVRVVKLMPKFKPGKDKGEPVRSAFILPIMFKLSDPERVKKK